MLIIHTRNKIISSPQKIKNRSELDCEIRSRRQHTHTHLMAPAAVVSVRFKFRITTVLSDMSIKILIWFPPILSAPQTSLLTGPSWVYFIKRQVGLPAESLGRKATRSIRRAKPTGLHCRGEKVDTNHLGLCKQAWTSREACVRLEVGRVSVVARERH